MNIRQTLVRYAALAFLDANLVWILWIWWSINGRLMGSADGILIGLGRISGLLLAFLLLTQVLLIGRLRWIEQAIGLDKLARVHHYLGFALAALLVSHPLLLAWGYGLRSDDTLLGQFIALNGWPDVLKATIAAGIFLFIIILSVFAVVKKIKYEVWYYLHLFTYVAVILAFTHQLAVGRDLQNRLFADYWIVLNLLVLAAILYFRFGLPLWRSWRYRLRVDKITTETPDTVSVYILGRDLAQFPIRGGQFMIVRYLAKGFWTEAHPYSLSCEPKMDHLRLTSKASGDYSKRLNNLKPGTPVLIDGPHGVFTHSSAVTGKRLYIAGGIGITPIRSLLGEKPEVDSILLYGCRTESDIALRGELESLAKRGLKFYCVLGNQPGWTGENGFIDKEKIRRLAPDFMERDVYLCGPWPMMKAVIAALDDLSFPRRQLHYEKFSL